VANKDKTQVETKDKETASSFKISTFFQETKEELGKVVWPSRQQLISESAAVLLMVVLSASLIYLVDGLFVWVSKQVF
jgi:preprotein translocase subunit SecE